MLDKAIWFVSKLSANSRKHAKKQRKDKATLDEKIDILDLKLDELELRVDANEVRLDDHETRIEALEGEGG